MKSINSCDTLCYSVFLRETNDRHHRTQKILASFKNKKTQESLFKSKGKSAEGVRSTQNAVNLSGKRMEERVMFTQINNFITWFDGVVWGLPLIILILIPVGLFMYYVYYSDNQAQGRYIMPKAAMVRSQASELCVLRFQQPSEPEIS